jgi:hypothetical protein
MSPKSSYEILDTHTIVGVLCMKWTSHQISVQGCEIAMKNELSQNKSTIVLPDRIGRRIAETSIRSVWRHILKFYSDKNNDVLVEGLAKHYH